MGSKQTGTATSTSNSSPWAPQQPYLERNFARAEDLYNNNTPQYFPGATYAQPSGAQNAAINGTINAASNNPLTATAGAVGQKAINGYYLESDPALSFFSSMAGMPNLGMNNNAAGTLVGQAVNGIANPATAGLSSMGGQNVGLNNPGAGVLQSMAGNNPALTAPGEGILNGYANTNLVSNNPAYAAVTPYTSGDRLAAGNPYTSALSDSVLSQVVPSIQNQFIASGTLSSPEAARATAAGATAALAPSLFSNYQNEEANQLKAIGQQNDSFMQGVGLQTNIANQLANLGLAGTGLQQNAASTLGSQALTGAGLQEKALGDLGSQALTGAGLQQSAASTFGNQAIQGEQAQAQVGAGLQNAYGTSVQQMLTALGLAPSIQSMPYTDLSQLYAAGGTQQQLDQQAINDAVQRWNYQQSLPYTQLNQLIGQTTGNYGGVTVGSQPIIGNPMQSTIGAIGSLAGMAKSDRRLKHEIVPLGESRRGLPVYAYKYKGEHIIHIGFMADEVEKVIPDAVVTGADGFKMVRYDLAAA